MPIRKSSELRFCPTATPLLELIQSLVPAMPSVHVRLRSSLKSCSVAAPPRDRKSPSDEIDAADAHRVAAEILGDLHVAGRAVLADRRTRQHVEVQRRGAGHLVVDDRRLEHRRVGQRQQRVHRRRVDRHPVASRLPVPVVEIRHLEQRLVRRGLRHRGAGTMPGSASAAAHSARPSVAATAASADAVTAARAFLARVDVHLRARVEAVVVELHLGLRELPLLPRLGRVERGATAERGETRQNSSRERIGKRRISFSPPAAP